VESHLWLPRSVPIPPQITAIRNAEISGNVNRLSFVRTVSDKLQLNFERPTERMPTFLEAANVHWGVEGGKGGVCGVCRLGLEEEVGITVAVFACGHLFHHACVPEQRCPSCYHLETTVHEM
jgi:hypothetical protein